MNKVTTIHLGGIAYQLEESAYDALRAYLDGAAQKLASDPDKDEILKDLEQAIGFKLNAHLSSTKNVLTLSEVTEVIKEMGPVSAETADENSDESTAKTTEWPYKKLYRIREGSVIAGVCTGLSAYFTIDVTLVRILFILLAILTHGVGIAIYGILWLVVPVALTNKDFEQAAGVPPITAQELIDRAKKGFDDVRNSSEWKSWMNNLHEDHLNWKKQQRAWKMQHKAWKHTQRDQWKAEQRRLRYEHRYEHHSIVSEIFGIACATLAISFVLWFLNGHVALFHDFFTALRNVYESFIASLAQLIYRGQ